MLPIDTTSKKFWGSEAAQVKIAEIRDGINDDLRRRDEGHGIGADGKVYDDAEGDPMKPGRLVVNPAKSLARSTGADHVCLLKSRWAQFCEKPQDEAAFVEKHRASDRARNRDTAVEAAASTEATLKRKRGPKVGSKNRASLGVPAETETTGDPAAVMAVTAGS